MNNFDEQVLQHVRALKAIREKLPARVAHRRA